MKSFWPALVLIYLLSACATEPGSVESSEIQERSINGEELIPEEALTREEALVPEAEPEPAMAPGPEPSAEPDPEPLPEEIVLIVRPPLSEPPREEPADLPVPEFRITPMAYRPLGKAAEEKAPFLALPLYRLSLGKPRVEEPKPGVLPPVPEPEETIPGEVTKSVSSAETTGEMKKPPPAAVEPENLPPKSPILKEEIYLLGFPAIVTLDGQDWLYIGEEDSRDPGFADRLAAQGQSLFTFSFPEPGRYVLLFTRFDARTGETEESRVAVTVEEEAPQGEDGSGETETETGEDSLEPAPGEIPPEEAPLAEEAQARERLDALEEDDPENAREILELLEFLTQTESDDDVLAAYYYRMARTLEMNSRFQDLRRSYGIYQLIEDRFFLTDYYELARERIRYLDRHFFKLR